MIGYRAIRLTLPCNYPATKPLESYPVGLYGFGASAHICLQILKHFSYRVFVFTRSPNHQKHARELGADWVGTVEMTPPEKVSSAIIFAPAGELVPFALKNLDKGGTLTLAGIHMTPIPKMTYSLIYEERVIRSVTNSTRQDVFDLLRLAEEIPLRTTIQTFTLEQANEALLAVKQSRLNGAAVLTID